MNKDEVEVAVGKSATIVSPSQLAINVGAANGVRVGDAAKVRRIVKVTDPDTGEELGEVHLTRVSLRISIAADSFSVGTVTDFVPSASGVSSIAAALESTRVRRRKTLVGSEFEASDVSVYVTPGESVVVTRALEVEDDS
ncbi:hypothetical protein [Frigoribacterium sp. R86507]|uniref:hypothetical protein n=1 Tax=Frigoribacterium sp. R86507 TaxID=3093850 RepID=UPI0037CC2056